MEREIHRIHPAPADPRPLAGTYLDAPLAPEDADDRLFVYANFVRSLDGRISVRGADGRERVPGDVANPRDWRLFQELAARADVLLSSGRYFRELAAGHAQDVLPVDSGEAFADCRAWRREHGLAPQPDVAVLSTSLDFTLPETLLEQGRRVMVLTTRDADEMRASRLAAAGAEVIRLDSGPHVSGGRAMDALAGRGYRRAYSVTGPWVLHALVADDRLDALFVTTVHRLIGGTDYAGILEGGRLEPAREWTLRWLYHDPHGPGPGGQQFARYDRYD
ncbi:RibD family protein [Arhodomonas sp. KWT2]|uniref:RibD family protein n=2 Tax=unclassified Arhodomonas TaxID=2621637 RepID=UPI0035C0B181